jgi:cytidylate kinase
MANSKHKEWVTKEGLIKLEGMALDGLVDEQIADNMGISVSTLYHYKNKYPKIDKALKKGKEVVDRQVENALLDKALNGNVTAMIFWLKNRKPQQWRDSQSIEHTAVKEIDVLEKQRMIERYLND